MCKAIKRSLRIKSLDSANGTKLFICSYVDLKVGQPGVVLNDFISKFTLGMGKGFFLFVLALVIQCP